MSGVELATAYVSLTVSARGISDDISNELNLPITKAAKQAGTDASKALAGGVKSGSSAIASEASGISSKFGSIGAAAKNAGGQITSQFSNIGSSILSAATSPAVLAGGIGALGVVAGKAIGEFQNLGLSVGKLSDATGLSAEAASRWIEVANDAGVSTETLSTSLGFMEKAAGKNPAVFDALGVSIAHAKDGTVDANATFLNAIDVVNGIKDPNEKAAAAVQLFGRSWGDMAELIGRGSGQLKTDLSAVQASKVFSAADVAQSRALRDAFDSIHDAVDGLFLTLGKSLAPAVAALAPKFAELISKAEPALKAVGDGLAQAAEDAGPLLDLLGSAIGALALLDGKHKIEFDIVGLDFDLPIPDPRKILPGVGDFLRVKDAWEELTKVEVKGGLAVDQYATFTAGANRLTAEAAQYLSTQAHQAQVLGAQTDRLTAQAKLYESTQAAVNGRLTAFNDAAVRATSSASTLTAAASAFDTALQSQAAGASASTRANLGLNESYDSLTASLKDNGKTFDDHTEKGRANIEALLGVGDAIRDNLSVQLKDSKGDYEQVTKAADLYRQQLVSQMTQAGLSADEQQHYLEVLGLTPEQVQTSIELSGQAAAQAAVSALNVSLDQFDDPNARQAYVEAIAQGDYETALNIIQKMTTAQDKTVNYSVNTTYREFGNRNGKPSATGGPAYAGRPYLIGDGPNGQIGKWTELFVPNVDGTIVSAPQLRSLMSMSPNSSGGGGGAAPLIGNAVFTSDVDVDGFFRVAQFHMDAT